ncbi:MAG: hypothetical protein IKW77_09945 [Salinivirgaceae bacterium]|nr:hypothetical protein [Salinivirgaceae bacterium]
MEEQLSGNVMRNQKKLKIFSVTQKGCVVGVFLCSVENSKKLKNSQTLRGNLAHLAVFFAA